ncbi:DUF559 domain-containing protein [Pseudonocardia sp. TRM90224]|uniref:DUF559 domain-containing protein n=1 Tax=Pseudonocardia sp. TRM90224 TaxID=2812678 RepID=UPI001E4CDE59|nr:DUF559 domain-containing protein [Pseudonocardia sp. TRM90224]
MTSGEPFIGSVAIAAGLVTRAQLRGSDYKSVYQGIYVAADVEPDLLVRSKAAHLLLPEHGALCGYSAAALLGAKIGPENVAAEVIASRGQVRARRGLIVRQHALDPTEVVPVDGYRVTSPIRTAWDLGRRLRLAEAVVAVDALARLGAFDPALLLLGPVGARGCRRLAEAVALANPLAESPMETRLRLLLVLAGLPAPVAQYPVFTPDGDLVARVDLAYPAAKLAIEYDGQHHFDEHYSLTDRARDLALDRLDWLTMRFTRDDVVTTPTKTVSSVRNRLAARLRTVDNDVLVNVSAHKQP